MREPECAMEMPAHATPRSEQMTTALVATRHSGYTRDIEKQILRFAQNDKKVQMTGFDDGMFASSASLE